MRGDTPPAHEAQVDLPVSDLNGCRSSTACPSTEVETDVLQHDEVAASDVPHHDDVAASDALQHNDVAASDALQHDDVVASDVPGVAAALPCPSGAPRYGTATVHAQAGCNLPRPGEVRHAANEGPCQMPPPPAPEQVAGVGIQYTITTDDASVQSKEARLKNYRQRFELLRASGVSCQVIRKLVAVIT